MSVNYTDHEGTVFNSKAEMCEHWGICRSAYDCRITSGWSVEEALTTPSSTRPNWNKRCQDHLGNTYANITAMCEHWGVNQSTYMYRIEQGQSIETALTTPTNRREHTDHTGQTFPSQAAMCAAWGISQQAFINRLKSGYTLKAALETPVAKRTHKVNQRCCQDHLGNEYPSHAAMCKAYNIDYRTFQERCQRGYTLEQALTGSKYAGNGKPCKDHEGNTFPSTAAMCRYWGISLTAFNSRIKSGLPLEEALTKPITKRSPLPARS